MSPLQMFFMDSWNAFSSGCLPNHAEGAAELQRVQEAVKTDGWISSFGELCSLFFVCLLCFCFHNLVRFVADMGLSLHQNRVHTAIKIVKKGSGCHVDEK